LLVYVWVASLYANDFDLKQLLTKETIGLRAVSKTSAWKTFFDQILSALSGTSHANRHREAVVKFLGQHGGALHNDEESKQKARWVLPAPLPPDMRGNASDEMRRAAVMHREGKAHGGGVLIKRTYCHLRNLLADEQARSGQINPGVGKGRLISVMLQVVRRKATIADLQAVDSSIAQAAFDIATSERDALDLYLKNPSLVDALSHAHRYSMWAAGRHIHA
jgi:hypothetical protein